MESADGPEDSIAEAELVELALAELSPKLRQCLLLGVVQGFSHHEIAETIGISETSVGTYISNARNQLRAIYQRLQSESDAHFSHQLVHSDKDDSKSKVLLLTV